MGTPVLAGRVEQEAGSSCEERTGIQWGPGAEKGAVTKPGSAETPLRPGLAGTPRAGRRAPLPRD